MKPSSDGVIKSITLPSGSRCARAGQRLSGPREDRCQSSPTVGIITPFLPTAVIGRSGSEAKVVHKLPHCPTAVIGRIWGARGGVRAREEGSCGERRLFYRQCRDARGEARSRSARRKAEWLPPYTPELNPRRAALRLHQAPRVAEGATHGGGARGGHRGRRRGHHARALLSRHPPLQLCARVTGRCLHRSQVCKFILAIDLLLWRQLR